MPDDRVSRSPRKVEDYRQSVLHVGGEVRDRSIWRCPVEEALSGLDGLLLTGGGDVCASALRRSAGTRRLWTSEPGRDEFELSLVAEARRRGLPIFAICRGVQVLNVACGGTLVQDIPSQLPGALEHSVKVPPHEAYSLAHEVWIDKDTLLSKPDGRTAWIGRHVRREQPASPGGEARGRRLPGLGHGARRRHRGDRGSRRRASASACSGTRRTSGARASSARCSKGSSRRRGYAPLNTTTVSTCGVFGKRSNASTRAIE